MWCHQQDGVKYHMTSQNKFECFQVQNQQLCWSYKDIISRDECLSAFEKCSTLYWGDSSFVFLGYVLAKLPNLRLALGHQVKAICILLYLGFLWNDPRTRLFTLPIIYHKIHGKKPRLVLILHSLWLLYVWVGMSDLNSWRLKARTREGGLFRLKLFIGSLS